MNGHRFLAPIGGIALVLTELVYGNNVISTSIHTCVGRGEGKRKNRRMDAFCSSFYGFVHPLLKKGAHFRLIT
jgi:hypothetical protein